MMSGYLEFYGRSTKTRLIQISNDATIKSRSLTHYEIFRTISLTRVSPYKDLYQR